MLKRVLGLLGWLGVVFVFAAVAIRFTRPEWQQWYNGLALAGLACTLLYILSQWREVARSFSGRQARLGSLAAARDIARSRLVAHKVRSGATHVEVRSDNGALLFSSSAGMGPACARRPILAAQFVKRWTMPNSSPA